MINPTTYSIISDVIVTPFERTDELLNSMAPFFAIFAIAVIALIIIFIKINKKK